MSARAGTCSGRLLGRVVRAACVGVVSIGAVALAPFATAAAADPATKLPDADLFCGEGYADKVASWSALPSAASQWIRDPVYGGHYVVLTAVHYRAPGLLFGPVEDLSSLTRGRSHTYGNRTGLGDEVISCQVVSRYADLDFTIIAPVTMARVND